MLAFNAHAEAAGPVCDTRKNVSPSESQLRDVGKFVMVSHQPTQDGFIWPTYGEVESAFGLRIHPIKKTEIKHTGLDISGAKGTPVVSAKAGVVLVSAGSCKQGRKKCNGGAGNLIEISHEDGAITRYLHLSQSCKLPKAGTQIARGEKIGCVGSTGGVTGPHLHFEVLKKGNYVDPETILPKKGFI